jgi:hypothetical protein
VQSPKNAAHKVEGVKGRAFEAAIVKARVKLASRFAKPHVAGATTGHVRRRSSEGKAQFDSLQLVVIDCCHCTYLYVSGLVSNSHNPNHVHMCFITYYYYYHSNDVFGVFGFDLSRQN